MADSCDTDDLAEPASAGQASGRKPGVFRGVDATFLILFPWLNHVARTIPKGRWLMADWKVKAAFKELHAPLSKDERRILEEEIVARGGARDPISTWRSFIADGHNRHEICERLSLPYTTVDLTERFHSQEEVEEWIIRNQLGRRNLTAERFSYFVGKLYNAEKKEEGRPAGKKLDQNDPVSTADKVASETGTSSATVKRAGKVAEAVDAMPASLKEAVLSGKVKASDKAKIAFAKAEPEVKSEAHRAVRTGQAPSLDVAMGLKAPKPEKPADPNAMKKDEFDAAKIEAAAAAEAAKPVKDSLGAEVPDDLKPAFRLSAEFKKHRQAVSQIKGFLTKELDGLAKITIAPMFNQAKTDLKNLSAALKFAAPFCVCIYCKSKEPKREKCNACKGNGWITAAVYNSAPEGLKK
jgi:hypothetical protein